jgi:hypothetical protein
MTTIEVEPQPRIDTVVRPPGGGEARQTEYAGTVRFDGKPQVSGLLLRRSPNAPRGVRTPTWIQVHVNGHLGWPAGVGYRVVVLTPPTQCGSA